MIMSSTRIGSLGCSILYPIFRLLQEIISMSSTKKIVIEVEETVVLRSGEYRAMDECPMCAEITEMATPWTAATLHRTTERAIFRLVELGLVHALEGERTLICLACVRKTVRDDNASASLIRSKAHSNET